MWRSQLSSLARKRATKTAVGTAVSLILLAELDRHEDQDGSTSSRVLSSYIPSQLLWSARTTCDAVMKNPPPRLTSLARHRTLRRMDDTATKSRLETRYEVQWSKPLGEGAFGAVYLATDRKTGDKVAVKKINKEFTDDVSFQREMNALMHVRKNGGHPNICSLRENFNEGGHYYLVLDLVSGGEMFDHLVNLGAYSEADAARLVREVASALAFIHGLDTVHGDMKPENVMLSSENPSDAVVKLVDFGCAQVDSKDSAFTGSRKLNKTEIANTPAYCPPEVLDRKRAKGTIDQSMDMWALGVILYIMLTGAHPFDLEGDASEETIKRTVLKNQGPPLKGSPITAHLSPDAIDVIEKLMTYDPKKRMTARQMLDHPWVRGETARRDKIADSDNKLSMYRGFKSRLELKVFEDIVNWSDENGSDISKSTSLFERAFHNLDPQHKGYITASDLKRLAIDDKGNAVLTDGAEQEEDSPLTLSGFSDLLSDHMRNKYYPKGHVIYREDDEGNHMYLLNSGTVEVTTKKGFHTELSQGEFFGEGALLHPKRIRSATVRAKTPVHVIEISREYFEKYLSSSGNLNLLIREKNKARKRHRARTLLRSHVQNMQERTVKKGEYLFKVGDTGRELFFLDDGQVEVLVEDHVVFTIKPGDMCGLHSLLYDSPRNDSALCVSDECKVHVMRGRDFDKFVKSSPAAKDSLYEMGLRREFQKAIVFKTKTPFPSEVSDLRVAFDAADEDSSGVISLDNVRTMLKRMDPSLTEKDVRIMLTALDLDETGKVSFEEFQRIFQMGDTVK